MKLIDLKLDDYLDILISDEPAPGGGSVSALACAQGAALVSMVCDLTISKKKYADDHELCGQIKEEAQALIHKSNRTSKIIRFIVLLLYKHDLDILSILFKHKWDPMTHALFRPLE